MNRKDPKVEAEKYFEENKINEIVQELLTRLLINKPDNPYEFLENEIKTLKQEKQSGEKPCYFTEQDKETVFNMFLPTGMNELTPEIAKKGIYDCKSIALEAVGQGDQIIDHNIKMLLPLK